MRKKLQNFWFYNKKHLLVALAVLLVLSYLGIQKRTTPEPDYHIGLVRAVQCTDAELRMLEETFTAAGTDVNADGQVLVQIHTYYLDLSDDSLNAGVRNEQAVSALDADLIGNVSGIFLLEDADAFRAVTGDILSDAPFSVENGLSAVLRTDAGDAYLALAQRLS